MNLRAWRKSEGLHIDEAATRLGIRPSTLASYEKGARRPKAEVAKRIEVVTRGAVSATSLLGLAAEAPAAKRRGAREDAAAFDGAPRLAVEIPFTHDRAERLRAAGVDIAAVARAGAEKALKEAEAKAWAEANREAIDAYNIWIEKHGTLTEQFGMI